MTVLINCYYGICNNRGIDFDILVSSIFGISPNTRYEEDTN